MRTLLFILTLFCLDFAQAQPYTPNQSQRFYFIPSGGQVYTQSSTTIPAYSVVTTNGSVNLSTNSYTLQANTTPPQGSNWQVYFDASSLTVSSGVVTIYGLTPLTTYAGAGKYLMQFNVDSTGLHGKYLIVGGTSGVNYPATFNAPVNFNTPSVKVGSIPAQAGLAVDTLVTRNGDSLSTILCSPWCVKGNSGLGGTGSVLGTLDSTALTIVVNGRQAGYLTDSLSSVHGCAAWGQNALLHNTGVQNTAMGVASLTYSTSGNYNTAVGGSAMANGTSASYNTAVGLNAMVTASSGSGQNVAVGYEALEHLTTGSGNVVVGSATATNITSGAGNIVIGAGAATAGATTNAAVAIGGNASADAYGIAMGNSASASPNQLAIAGIRSMSFPGMTSCAGCILTDTTATGTGQAIFAAPSGKQQTTFTPVTGDSITPITENNLINPSGTIANFTIKLPGSPTTAQKLEFSFTQVVTTLHWSVALNQSNAIAASVPTSATVGSTIKIMWNTTNSTWYNW